MNRNISKTMKQIYGTGNFNPRSFDRRPSRNSKSVYLWGIALFLLVIAALIVGGMWVFGVAPASFNGEKVIFELEGNTNPSTSSKEEYRIKIVNNEEVKLKDVELFIDWQKTQTDSGQGVYYISSEIAPKSDTNDSWNFGTMAPGEEIEFVFSARFAGPVSSDITLPLSLNVKPEGFENYFSIKRDIAFSLGESNMKITINAPDYAQNSSDFEMVFLLSGDSFSSLDISKLFVKAVFPDNFLLSNSNPEQTNSEWRIASLPREGDSYKIVLNGSLSGESSKENIFSFGVYKDGEAQPITSEQKKVIIQSSDASISISASPAQGKKLQWGERINYSVKLENTGSYAMRNVVVTVSVDGESLWNEDTIAIENGGFFEAGKFIWDSSVYKSLESIMPEESVMLVFSFETNENPPKTMSSPPVLSVQAASSCEINVNNVSAKSAELKTNVLADVDFDVTGWYTNPEGIDVGSGPNPPQEGQETVYEVEFKLGPTTSELKNLELSMHASNIVSWKNQTNYSTGEVTYDEISKTLFWRSSKVPALDIPISIRFKIGVTPQSAVSNSTLLFDNIKFKAVDSSAGEDLEFFGGNLTFGNIE